MVLVVNGKDFTFSVSNKKQAEIIEALLTTYQLKDLFILPVLQIRNGSRDNLGIISHISRQDGSNEGSQNMFSLS